MSPLCGALMTLSVRRLGKTDHPASTALWYNLLGTIVFLLFCVLTRVEWPQFNEILIILLIVGIVSSIQQICLAYSLKFVAASLLAPLRYISVPIGIVVGVYFFNETLSPTFFIGTVIVVSASIIIIRRESKNR